MIRIPVFLALMLSAVTLAGAAQAKPNFVIFIGDDLTGKDIGCYGGQAKTPAIDKVAAEGLRFTRCFQAAPMCSPTRHNLYTGMYPVKTGAYPNHTFVSRPGTKSIVQRLKKEGYRVAMAGKRHIQPKEVLPFEFLDDPMNFKQVNNFITSCSATGTPFCLVMASHYPHGPWEDGNRDQYPPDKLKLSPRWVDTPETRAAFQAYLAETSVYDDEVSSGMALLDSAGVTSNTAVMILSEQGCSIAGGKWNLYDPGIHSACIVRWPGVVKSGTVTDAMIEYVDVVPTLVEAAGGRLTDELEGKSFLNVLKGKADSHKDYVYSIQTMRGVTGGTRHYGMRAVRSATHKYIWNFTPREPFKNGSVGNSAFRSWEARAEKGDADAKAKVDLYLHRPEIELYNIVDDPYEMRNIADDPSAAKIKADLRTRLDAWMKQQGDKGQATEMEAYDHQPPSRREKDAADEKAGKSLRKDRRAERKSQQADPADEE